MDRIKLVLKYVLPYKGAIFTNIIYNLLSAVFALFSYSLAVPFLKVLFSMTVATPHPGEFQMSVNYISTLVQYYLTVFIDSYGRLGALMIVCLVFLIASLLKNGFIFLSNNSMAYIRSSTVRDIRKNIYSKILRLPVGYFSDARKGDILTRVSNDVQEIEISVISSLTMLIRDPITVVIFLIYLFVTSYQLTLFALLLLPVSGWFIGKASKSLRSKAFLGQENLGRVLSVLEESLSGLRIIKGFNAEKKMEDLFNESNERYSKIFKRVIRKNYLASPLSEFLGSIVVIVLMYFGGSLALEEVGSLTPDRLIAFVIVFTQIIQPLKQITAAWFNISKGVASIERVEQLFNAEETITDPLHPVKIDGFNNSIEFRGVWFSYNSEPVLKDINLEIRKGQTVAIVGKSGAGKSTLVDLLPRFIDPDKGGVFIDGVDIRDIAMKDLRNLMGIVSQNPILFNTSFTENIAFGIDGDIDAKRVEEAARIANAHDFIIETEKGYESLVGESGGKLSGGQRQRVSIARAIMANPPILILDEATSALDTESERLVQDAISKLMKNRTSLIIAHRLSTIQKSDLIVVMDEGRIVECGNHVELVNKIDGYYSRLCGFQSLG
ncbi:MAG TPA: ABC transporter ATP-binding protein [Bacteroidetes bacterium]|nr:ABC transporter ATP-binding protein [Bacteroidota bacterium]